MCPNLSAKHSKKFATNLEFRVSSTTYYPTVNDFAEVFNKTIGKLLKKFLSKSQRDWGEKLGECL